MCYIHIIYILFINKVPSWRVKVYTPDEYIHTTENTDEEIYLKRHLKMEMEEKRRKRYCYRYVQFLL